jgi:hypothetical protein
MRVKKERKEFNLFTRSFMYEQYKNQIGDIVHLDKHSIDHLLEKCNIPRELLKQDSLHD